jgi:hypothetical protein
VDEKVPRDAAQLMRLLRALTTFGAWPHAGLTNPALSRYMTV